MSNSKTFHSIEQLNNIICDYCLDGILDKSDMRYRLYHKIRNLTLRLQNVALRLTLGKSSLLSPKLSLEQIKNLMVKIYEIINQKTIEETEDNIKQLIQDYSLNLDELWFDDPTADEEQRQLQDILEGVS